MPIGELARRFNGRRRVTTHYIIWSVIFVTFLVLLRDSVRILKKGEFNYVSFGVGEGRKDGYVINTFFSGHEEDCTYFPVDMSIEMLRLAMLHIQDR